MKHLKKIVKVGDKAPSFIAQAVINQTFEMINLSSYLKKKYVVLLFYPYDFSFVCPTELTAFSSKYDIFTQLDTEVLFISPDSHHTHLAWIQAEYEVSRLTEIPYPLVSDPTREICKAYNVLDNSLGVPLRALFIIDKAGIIQCSTIHNLNFGRSVDEALRVLQALQYVQTYPEEYCPANWQPGENSINPSHLESNSRFSTTS